MVMLSQLLWRLELSLKFFRLRITGAKPLINQIDKALENGDTKTAREVMTRLRKRCGVTAETVSLRTRIDVYEIMKKGKNG